MLRKILDTILLFVLLAFLLLTLNFLVFVKAKLIKSAGATFRTNSIGEKIVYDVSLGKLYLGKARFENLADARVNGRVLNAMLLETRLARFKDTEKIYSDPRTFLPVRVERDILNWFAREKITEEYDQNKFTVTIIKDKGSRQEKSVIKKDSRIHNAVLLPFSVRRIPKMDVGRIIIANLPVRRLEIKLISIEKIKVPAGTFQAYRFQSTPRQIDIWISADERRIPIKIQGSGVFGYTLAMKEHRF